MTDDRVPPAVGDETATRADDGFPFSGGRPETTDELKARGRFRLRAARQRRDAERQQRERERLELAALAESGLRQALPRCLWEFMSCGVEGANEQMALSIRLPRHPRIYIHLEPAYDNGHGRPVGYHLPRRPGRFWRVGDLADAVETIEEALALAVEDCSEQFTERTWGSDPRPAGGASMLPDLLLTALQAVVIDVLEHQVCLQVAEAVQAELARLGKAPTIDGGRDGCSVPPWPEEVS
jgi:hypothetical protein